jgi:hypothetical protein
MHAVYCQINKIRLQKVASNENLVSGVLYALTYAVTFRSRGRAKLVTGALKKSPKMVFVEGLLMLRGASCGQTTTICMKDDGPKN